MDGYKGDFDVDIKDTPYADYTPQDWALNFIGSYGQIDGGHHKLWVLDQVARILKGTPIILKEARWDGDEGKLTEYRYWTGEPSQEYLDWVIEMKGDYDEENEEYEYGYDEGCAP